jgi:hypothetical protein
VRDGKTLRRNFAGREVQGVSRSASFLSREAAITEVAAMFFEKYDSRPRYLAGTAWKCLFSRVSLKFRASPIGAADGDA